MNDTKSFIYIKQMYMKGFFHWKIDVKKRYYRKITGILLSRHIGKMM